MKHLLQLTTALVATIGLLVLGLAACSGPGVHRATQPPAAASAPAVVKSAPAQAPAATVSRPVSTMSSMRVGPLTRSWLTIRPALALPRSAPIIVELSGIGSTVAVESTRNRLIPYADADQAELVYPVAVARSWDAIGCCGPASRLKINDLGFLERLVPRIDPGHQRPVYVVGYSNGGRMVYALECADPGLFDGMAAVKADPMPGCVVTRPQNVLVISAIDDPAVPFATGETGKETPPATVQVARLQAALGCRAKPTAAPHGDMTLTTWSSCSGGRQLGWAVYTIGGHNFPPPTARSPSAAQVIYSFFTRTALAPLPG